MPTPARMRKTLWTKRPNCVVPRMITNSVTNDSDESRIFDTRGWEISRRLVQLRWPCQWVPSYRYRIIYGPVRFFQSAFHAHYCASFGTARWREPEPKFLLVIPIDGDRDVLDERHSKLPANGYPAGWTGFGLGRFPSRGCEVAFRLDRRKRMMKAGRWFVGAPLVSNYFTFLFRRFSFARDGVFASESQG